MGSMPLVSVIVATKNSARYVGEALESISAQTYGEYEAIVMDAASTDRTVEIAQVFLKTRVVQQRGQGFAGAWNEGIAAARGELIAFLDSDDRWAKEKLEKQVAVFVREPQMEMVIARMEYFLEREGFLPPGFKPELLARDHLAYFPGAMLVRRELFERIGTFGTEWKIASDVEWFKRVKDSGVKVGIVPEVLYYKRVHDANLSYYQARNFNHELIQLLKQSLERKRKGESL